MLLWCYFIYFCFQKCTSNATTRHIRDSVANIEKLKLLVRLIRRTCKGICYNVIDMHCSCTNVCDMQLSEIDFQDSLKAIGLSEELQQALLQQYTDNRAFIRSIQKELSMDLPHYTNLEWRLDVKVTIANMLKSVRLLISLSVNTCVIWFAWF